MEIYNKKTKEITNQKYIETGKNEYRDIAKLSPEQLSDYGYLKVEYVQPNIGEFEKRGDKKIVESDTVATVSWEVVPLDAEVVQKKRLSRLENIFTEKTTGLKRLAIDKPYMTNEKAINDQYRVYEEMYKNALSGLYDEEMNNEIITANESAKAITAPLTLLLNSVRHVLEINILANSEDVDHLLDIAEAITLTKDEITPERMLEIQTAFGLI